MTAELTESYPVLSIVEDSSVEETTAERVLRLQQEIADLTRLESLTDRRVRLQQRLGELSKILCEVQSEYTSCINEIIQTNQEILHINQSSRSIDTNALIHRLQPPEASDHDD